MPHTKPDLQFNFPSVASLKYYPRNEIRAPEYRVWSSAGRRMETWPDSEAKRHALVGGGGLDHLPKWHGKYLPSTTWLSRHIHSAPFPSLLCSAQKRRKLPWSARQGAKPATKSFPSLPEVTKVQQPGKTGLCIFKTSGPTFGESRAHQARHRWGGKKRKKKKRCQMIFVLSNDLEKGTLRTQRAVSADLSDLVFHIHYLFLPPSHGRILIAYNSD